MADHCKSCNHELFNLPESDFKNEAIAKDAVQWVLCEGCGWILVDAEGVKIAESDDRYKTFHAPQNRQMVEALIGEDEKIDDLMDSLKDAPPFEPVPIDLPTIRIPKNETAMERGTRMHNRLEQITVARLGMSVEEAEAAARDAFPEQARLMDALCGPETSPGSGIRLNAEQECVSDAVIEWVEIAVKVRRGQMKWQPGMTEEETVTGLAGTGKTTVMAYLVRALREKGINVAVIAPTGKAASVLRSKGVAGARTIHGFAYNFDGVEENEHTGKEKPLFERKLGLDNKPDVLFVDESSMVNREMEQDLKRFRVPIVFFGDHGQLPPIGDDPKVLENARWKLEQIMRQAEGSSILKFAYYLRSLQGHIPAAYHVAREDLRVCSPGLNGAMEEIAAEYNSRFGTSRFDGYQAIVGTNETRFDLNRYIRKTIGWDQAGDICEGERIIIVRTNYQHGVYNGEQYIIDSICDVHEFNRCVSVNLRPLGAKPSVRIHDEFQIEGSGWRMNVPIYLPTLFREPVMRDQMDPQIVFAQHGYAITAHKSQGSEWDDVAVVDQPIPWREPQRWRYTAATRARKTLVYYA